MIVFVLGVLYGMCEIFKNDELKLGNALLSLIQFFLIVITVISILNDFKIII